MSSEVYCDGRCDSMGCRGHDVEEFRTNPDRVDDPVGLAVALFELLDAERDARPSSTKDLAELFSLLARLPADQFLVLTNETTDDELGDERARLPMQCACIMQKPPEGGWASRGAYFRHPEGSDSYNVSAEPYAFDDACLEGISAYNADDAASLTLEMLRRRGGAP